MKIIIAVRISFSDNLAFQTINIDGISDLMIIISRKTARCIICFCSTHISRCQLRNQCPHNLLNADTQTLSDIRFARIYI